MSLSPKLKSFLTEVGDLSRFTGRFLQQWYKPRYEIAEFGRQCFVIGYQSFALVGLTAFIMGLVLTMQLRPSMVDYGVSSQIPAIVSISIVREIGPVITALIFADREKARKKVPCCDACCQRVIKRRGHLGYVKDLLSAW